MKAIRLRWVFAALACTGSSLSDAHGGGLDANGCHFNRRTGEYHCHRGGYQNELAVYWNQTPPRGGDWHHWMADLLGLATMYAVRRRLYLTTLLPRPALVAA